MGDKPAGKSRAPWHLWVVGVLSLLWNSGGAYDFTMTETRNAAYLHQFPQEILDYVDGFPLWAVLAWGIATWGSVIGSVLLLARTALAVPAFGISFVAMLVTMVHSYLLSDGMKVMGGPNALIFSGAIFVVAALLIIYSRVQRRRGVLR